MASAEFSNGKHILLLRIYHVSRLARNKRLDVAFEYSHKSLARFKCRPRYVRRDKAVFRDVYKRQLLFLSCGNRSVSDRLVSGSGRFVKVSGFVLYLSLIHI